MTDPIPADFVALVLNTATDVRIVRDRGVDKGIVEALVNDVHGIVHHSGPRRVV